MTVLPIAEAPPACQCCGAAERGRWWHLCADCERHVPAALAKALEDPFDYALRLRTGEVIRFEQATLHGDYVRLYGAAPADPGEDYGRLKGAPFPCPRGLDVRLADIVWCADAPEGS